MIVAFRDLFGKDREPHAGDFNTNGLTALEYPARKPKNTYRIILVGDSRSSEVQPYSYKTDFHPPTVAGGFPQNLTFAPQVEQELNLLAALDDAHLNFEVMNFGQHGEALIWPTYAVPDVVRRNDVDLVVVFVPRAYTDWMPYHFYFDHPLDPDGIPRYPNDPEYNLKPPLERIPDGTPRRFYDYCFSRGWVKVKGNALEFDERLIAEPQLRNDLLEMYGRPLDVLNRKLAGMRTSAGEPVRLLLLSTYTGRGFTRKYDIPLWIEAAQKYGVPSLDLTAEVDALHLTYGPLTGDETHLNPNGGVFFGRLLARRLIQERIIPWVTDPVR